MKRFLFFLLFSLWFCPGFICHSNLLFAQTDENERWFLLHPGSGEIIGTAAPSFNNAVSFMFNPSYVAFTEDSIDITSSYGQTQWPSDFSGSERNQPAYALNIAGYLPKQWSRVPISIGGGALYTKVDLGKNTWADTSGGAPIVAMASEVVSGYALAIAMHSMVDVSFGLNLKRFRSILGPASLGGRAVTNQWEAGCLVHIPLTSFFKKGENRPDNFIRWQAGLDLGLVYPLNDAQLIYVNSSVVDYLPKSINGGWQISAIMMGSFKKKYLPFLDIRIGSEVNILRGFKNNSNTGREWKAGEFNFFDNFAGGNPGQGIDTRNRFQIGFMNLFQYQSGNWQRKDRKIQRADSYAFYSRGLFDILKWFHLPERTTKIIDYFDIRVAKTTYSNSSLFEQREITIKSLSLMLHLTY